MELYVKEVKIKGSGAESMSAPAQDPSKEKVQIFVKNKKYIHTPQGDNWESYIPFWVPYRKIWRTWLVTNWKERKKPYWGP